MRSMAVVDMRAAEGTSEVEAISAEAVSAASAEAVSVAVISAVGPVLRPLLEFRCPRRALRVTSLAISCLLRRKHPVRPLGATLW